jgi:hypothetical protein
LECKNCRYQNPTGSRFCSQCGEPFAETKSREQVSLGDYELSTYDQNPRPYNHADDDYIYDREVRSRETVRRGPLMKIILILLLAAFSIGAFYSVNFAVATNEKRSEEAAILEIQKKEAEELAKLENYMEKYNQVVQVFDQQGALIDESISSISKVNFNNFLKKLGLGITVDKIVDKVLDISSIKNMKANSSKLDILLNELASPPKTFEGKYESLVRLKEIDAKIMEYFEGAVSKDIKKNLEDARVSYTELLSDIKR